jgi:hypothetical protein
MIESNNDHIILFARTNFRNRRQVFGIKARDRGKHVYIIGQTGTGKTTLLETMILEDLKNGQGLAVIDPHGDFVDRIAKLVPEVRAKDLIYLNTPDPNCQYGFNPLAGVREHRRPLAASGILEAFQKIWTATWGPRMEHILRNTLLTLLEQPNATLSDVARLYGDELYRRQALARVKNEQVKRFWNMEFDKYTPRYKVDAFGPIQNKVGAFLADPLIHRIMTAGKENLNLPQIMDEEKILLVNLAKGRIGADNSALLGAMLVSHLGLAALSRADMPEQSRRDFYLYLDEFQNFTTYSMVTMLSELRKYRLNLVMAHQYLSQMEPEMQDAIFGNVGTLISFRIGVKDAALLAKEFQPTFSVSDFINLPNFSIYLRLLIDGKKSDPFSADTLPPG